MLVGIAFTYGLAFRIAEPRVMVNRFLTFLPVFANGMMAAHLYAWYASRVKRKAIISIVGMLVAVGACIFILISDTVIANAVANGGMVNNDNLRVLAQIVTGMGFLGAGVILRDGFTIHGLNSAATLWCSAAVGSMCGYGLWKESIIAVSVILFINWVLKSVERFMELHHKDGESSEKK